MNKIQTFEELFDSLDTQSVFDILLDLGSQGNFPKDLQVGRNFVNGCQSQVWIVGFEDESGKLKFHGTSDSYMVRGVVYLVCDICSDMSLDELQQLNWQTLEPIGKYFTAQRKRGMQSMINKIKSITKDYTSQTQ